MRLSVAMTTYCGERYVEKQLCSLLSQTRAADEVVIIDDCSTDKTAGIVSSFIEEHGLSNWHFSVNLVNLGYKKNFKEAISRTTGDLVFLCDQDDIWYPDKLEKMEPVFTSHPDCMALNTSFCYVDSKDAPITIAPARGMCNHNLIKRVIPAGALEPVRFDEIACYNISPGCTMAFRTEVRALYLAHSVCGVVHDWELNLIAALLDGCYFLNTPLIAYRIHGGNAVGIPGVAEGDDVDRGAYAYRLSVAKQMKDYTECFRVYLNLLDHGKKGQLLSQLQFVSARYEALRTRKLKRLLSLYRYHKNYQNSVTWKGRLADLACIIK